MKLRQDVLEKLYKVGMVKAMIDNEMIYITLNERSFAANIISFTLDELQKIDDLRKAIKIKKMFQKYFGKIKIVWKGGEK